MLTLASVMNRLHLEDVKHQIHALVFVQPMHSRYSKVVCCTGLLMCLLSSVLAEETI